MAEAPKLISEQMAAAIGTVLRRRTSYPVSASDIRKWALAVYYPDPPPERFMGQGAAAGEPPLTAPEEFNPFAWAAVGEAPLPRNSTPAFLELEMGIEPPKVTAMVNGGSACEYGVAMREGDVISAEFSLRSHAQKEGRNGPMLITEMQDLWRNRHGEVVRTYVSTIIRF